MMMTNNEDGKTPSPEAIESAYVVDEIYKKHKDLLNLKGREDVATVGACADSLLNHLDELRKKYETKK